MTHAITKVTQIKFKIKAGIIFISLLIGMAVGFAYNYNATAPVQDIPAQEGYAVGTHWGGKPVGLATVKSQCLAKVIAVPSEVDPECWVGVIDNYTVSLTVNSYLHYPLVQVDPTPAFGGYQASSAFADDILQHENWHREIHQIFSNNTWSTLESYLNNYESKECATQSKAIANAKADIGAAFDEVEYWYGKYEEDKLEGHPGTVTSEGAQVLNGNWTATNPDWGAAAKTLIQAYRCTYTWEAGNCCLPE